jgi:hypothetical protein
MSCYPTHFWEVKHANLGGVFDENIGTDPQCLCHVHHPGGHRFRQSLPGMYICILIFPVVFCAILNWKIRGQKSR